MYRFHDTQHNFHTKKEEHYIQSEKVHTGRWSGWVQTGLCSSDVRGTFDASVPKSQWRSDCTFMCPVSKVSTSSFLATLAMAQSHLI